MAKAPIVRRNKGRPTSEESAAIAMDIAMIKFNKGIADLVVPALDTLRTLLSSKSEKTQEQVAKFIIGEAKEARNAYIAEDNENEAAGGGVSASSDAHAGQIDASAIPLSLEIAEFKKNAK